MKKLLSLTLALTVAAAPAFGATFTKTPDFPVLLMRGPIVPGDTDRFMTALAKNKVSHVALQSVGGDLVEGLAMAVLIKRLGLGTIATDVCASSCFTMFLAGKEKRSFENSCLGVHHVSLNGRTHASATLELAGIFKNWDVPPVIIGKMTMTEPGEISWLTRQEMAGMQVILTGRHTIISTFSCN